MALSGSDPDVASITPLASSTTVETISAASPLNVPWRCWRSATITPHRIPIRTRAPIHRKCTANPSTATAIAKVKDGERHGSLAGGRCHGPHALRAIR